jgi:hypothetical protein
LDGSLSGNSFLEKDQSGAGNGEGDSTMAQLVTTSCMIAPHLKHKLATSGEGKYGRMFADLPRNDCEEAALLTLGRSGSALDATDLTDREGAAGENDCIPAGYPIFGQFIAHDITADRSLLQHHANLGEIRNFRTPSLNLESLYGAGPTGTPYLYDMQDGDKFLLGADAGGALDDLPRNAQGRALTGDPRNDVHQLIAQMHVAFLKFHNAIVDYLRGQGVDAGSVFGEAQRLVRWHYQWIAAQEYLPLVAGEATVQDILTNGRRFYEGGDRPFIPIEFSDGAYRFGHSQIRTTYRLNDQTEARIFPDLLGSRPIARDHLIDWRYFFAIDPAQPPQPSRRIDARLAHPLIDLPDAIVGTTAMPEERSLAYRDLQREYALDMPSGEAVARAMGIAPLTAEQVGLAGRGWSWETPLWLYVMKEAEVTRGGVMLGEMGGRIVAEVIVGLLDGDPLSYRNAEAPWTPTLPAAQPGSFTMADLLRFADAA